MGNKFIDPPFTNTCLLHKGPCDFRTNPSKWMDFASRTATVPLVCNPPFVLKMMIYIFEGELYLPVACCINFCVMHIVWFSLLILTLVNSNIDFCCLFGNMSPLRYLVFHILLNLEKKFEMFSDLWPTFRTICLL